jgi:hypothetical protein
VYSKHFFFSFDPKITQMSGPVFVFIPSRAREDTMKNSRRKRGRSASPNDERRAKSSGDRRRCTEQRRARGRLEKIKY